MREIKFRAWDNRTQQMITDWLVWSDAWSFKPYELGEYTPMQYTGIKDKNGVEIWEGDILIFSLGENDPNKSIHAVEYGGTSWDYNGSTYGFSMGDDYGYREAEVIGNIYENPELLK